MIELASGDHRGTFVVGVVPGDFQRLTTSQQPDVDVLMPIDARRECHGLVVRRNGGSVLDAGEIGQPVDRRCARDERGRSRLPAHVERARQDCCRDHAWPQRAAT